MPPNFEDLARPGVGYNGVMHEPCTQWQMLGNGYRVYSPALQRFHSPDDLSPFHEGGVNAYAYALADPINREDQTGQFAQFIGWGALALGVGSGMGAAISYAAGEKKALDVLAVAAVGLVAAAAMIAAARFIPGRLSPKIPGQQPTSRKYLPKGDMRLYHMKDGTHVLDMHGGPGVGNLGGWPAGPAAVAKQVQLAAGKTPIKQLQMQVCFGANKGPGGMPSLGQGVSRKLGVPVMAFEGKVSGVGKRLTYKIGHEQYFFPDRRPTNRIGTGERNPWRLGEHQFGQYVRQIRNRAGTR